MHLQEEDRGRGSWQLDADYGEIFEALGQDLMKKVTIRINEPTRDWTVNSDEGELARDSKDVELRGHVVVVSSDGLRLETDRLNWMAKEQRVWTDQPVTIWRNGMVVQRPGVRVAGQGGGHDDQGASSRDDHSGRDGARGRGRHESPGRARPRCSSGLAGLARADVRMGAERRRGAVRARRRRASAAPKLAAGRPPRPAG